MKRFMPLIFGLTVTLVAAICGQFLSDKLIFNYTDSLPHGFYFVTKTESYKRGDLIVFDIPVHVKQMVIERQYLVEDGQFMKLLVAQSGEFFCNSGPRFVAGSRDLGNIKVADRAGRMLPKNHYCGVLKGEQIGVGIEGDVSFDSRYFGPILASGIKGKARPIFTF